MDIRASRPRGSQLHDEIVEDRRFARVDIAAGKRSVSKPLARAAEATSHIGTGLRTIGMVFIACVLLALLALFGPEASPD